MHGGIVAPTKLMDLELVVKPTANQLYLRDHGKPMDVSQAKGKLTLLAGTEKQEIELKPAGDKLEATGSFKVGPGTKAVAVVTVGGKTATARFTFKLPETSMLARRSLALGGLAALGMTAAGCATRTPARLEADGSYCRRLGRRSSTEGGLHAGLGTARVGGRRRQALRTPPRRPGLVRAAPSLAGCPPHRRTPGGQPVRGSDGPRVAGSDRRPARAGDLPGRFRKWDGELGEGAHTGAAAMPPLPVKEAADV